MPYDLAISEHGDLIVTAHRDLAGISGKALIEQRIKLRLRLHRGQWSLDRDGTLGSQLFTVFGEPDSTARAHAIAFVREALRDMNEISVQDVQFVTEDSKQLILVVIYQNELNAGDATIPADTDLQEITVAVPIVAANE